MMEHKRKKIALLWLISGLLLLSIQSSWSAQKRIALVIGNSIYKDAPLKNPSNDATDMASKLTQYGFTVDKLINVDNRQMKLAIQRFGKKLRDENTVGLFYFAGHGVQVGGANYLLPVNANIESEADIEFEAVNAARVLHQMERSENNLNLVILDACRNNPFARSFRNASQGLAKMEAPNGSMILYATSPGNVAADGEGRNGLFTEKLLQMMNKKGLKIEEVFKQTAKAVSQASGKKQYPYIEGYILGDFYFTGPLTINQSPRQLASADPDMVGKAENRFWDSVEADPSKEMFEEYLKAYPDGHYAGLARIKLKKLNGKSTLKPPPQITTGKVTIRSNVNGDKVLLNGENKGSTRLDLNLNPGIYALEVNKNGYDTWEHNLDIKAGSEQVVYAKLKRTAVSGMAQNTVIYNRPKAKSAGTGRRTIIDSATGMELVKVPKGCFQMGNKDTSIKHTRDERPVHNVCITNDFYLGKYEVTQGQWQAIMGSNPSHFKKGDQHPVERVSWKDVQSFIKKLNALTGHHYRLPTEAEWEYAAKAGGTTKYPWGNNIDCSKASYDGGKSSRCYHKSDGHLRGTSPVGSYQPNEWGIYDTAGNVWEWVQDRYYKKYYQNSPTNDPTGPSGGFNRVNRGGSWSYSSMRLRSAFRSFNGPGIRSFGLGVRLARSL